MVSAPLVFEPLALDVGIDIFGVSGRRCPGLLPERILTRSYLTLDARMKPLNGAGSSNQSTRRGR